MMLERERNIATEHSNMLLAPGDREYVATVLWTRVWRAMMSKSPEWIRVLWLRFRNSSRNCSADPQPIVPDQRPLDQRLRFLPIL